MDSIIKTAIATKRLLEFTYDGLPRIVEPHVYGVQDGKHQLLAYQIGGRSSSGNLPNWRRMDLDKISNMRMLDQTFPGSRPTPSGKHSSFDTTIAVVR
jgi:hypothetical protein